MNQSIYYLRCFRCLILLSAVAGLMLVSCSGNKNDVFIFSAPAGSMYTSINKDGVTVIPNGCLLTPTGRSLVVAPHPFGLALSRNGEIAVTANSGTSPLSITIIRNLLSSPEIIQVPPGPSTDKGILESVFMGLAISPENDKVYVSGGQTNKIFLFDLKTGAKTDSIDCSVSDDGTLCPHGYIGDMTISGDGIYVFAVDQINFRLIIADTRKMKIIRSIPVGRYPFGLALTRDEKKIYVANVGMFQYSKIEDIEAKSDIKKAFLLSEDQVLIHLLPLRISYL